MSGLRSILPATPFAMHACCFACEGVVGVGFYAWSAGHCQRPFEARRLPPCPASARRRAVLGVGRDLRNQRDGEPALVW